jgi:ATP-dependent Lon protease
MYHIHTKGYDTKEKIAIARSHLLPLIQQQMQFAKEDIVLPDATLRHILTTTLRTQDAGVRQFKRALESIHAKLNLLRLTATSGLFAKDLALGHAFPFTVLPQHVDVLLKECAAPPLNPSVLAMFI